MPRPRTNWVLIRVKIPSEWKDVLEEIRKTGAYESISDVVRSIVREHLITYHFEKEKERKELKQLIRETMTQVLREHKLIS